MQNKMKMVALLAGVLFLNSGTVLASDNFWGWMGRWLPPGSAGVKPVDDKQYKDECGSCHFAYQPGLLPGKSWEKLLTAEGLHDHFGEVADLDNDTLQAIRAYVLDNAAEKSYFKIARKIVIATEDAEPPLRITEVRFIKRKHHELTDNMVKGNKDVRSLSYCDACHTKAAKGVFDSDTVSIPNFPDF